MWVDVEVGAYTNQKTKHVSNCIAWWLYLMKIFKMQDQPYKNLFDIKGVGENVVKCGDFRCGVLGKRLSAVFSPHRTSPHLYDRTPFSVYSLGLN